MHFAVFVPEFRGEGIDALAHAGCAEIHAEGDLSPSAMSIERGPEGRPGSVIHWIDHSADSKSQPACDYDPAWEWLPFVPAVPHPGPLPKGEGEKATPASYYVGVNWDAPPRPAELLRWRPESFGRKIPLSERVPRYDGPVIKLGDDQAWTLPNQWSLPMALVLDPKTGEYKREPKRKLRTLWEEFQAAFDQTVKALEAGSDERDVPGVWGEREMRAHVARMLGLNYRGNEFVFTLLEAIDNQNVLTCLAHTTDAKALSAVLASVKKKRAERAAIRESSDTAAGVTVS